MVNMYHRIYKSQDESSAIIYNITNFETRRKVNTSILDLEDIYSHVIEDNIENTLQFLL
jgi:hypothetical protein